MDNLPKRRVGILVAVLASIIMASGLVINANAAPKSSVTGSGLVLLTCGDGTRVDEPLVFNIEALAAQGKVKLQGSFHLRNSIGDEISGDIFGGKISKTSYSLLSNYLVHSGICVNDQIPSQGTISATCGNSVSDLELRFDNGARGIGTGSFACSK